MQRWFDRKFEPLNTNLSFEGIMERLADTPLRLSHKIHHIDPAHWTLSPEGAWSIQEQVGHLLDLEPLWLGRVQDFKAGQETLRPADLSNRKTHDAGHNDTAMTLLLDEFGLQRKELVKAFLSLSPEERERTALHPRLRTPMLPVDLAYFVAEHDDHHLASITRLADDHRNSTPQNTH
ncbi:MAG: DinB family protein [Saprospiraceae bacterium]|nr:DinB family protein [Saprospiraceae bacterium]